MKLNFVAHPRLDVGGVLTSLLASDPLLEEVVLVSAFANRHTLLRLRNPIAALREHGTAIRVIVGIDLGGTSDEALVELESWKVDARVVKHRRGGHTFHPKIYLLKRSDTAHLLVGSSNLTEGGLYTNYEVMAHAVYSFPTDKSRYERATAELANYLDPTGPVAKPLSEDLIHELAKARLVLPERELQESRRRRGSGDRAAPLPAKHLPFGVEPMPIPPPIPAEVITQMMPEVAKSRRSATRRAKTRKVSVKSGHELIPTAFYMELNRLQGPRIPGEARIPLAARDIAEEFWGWPNKYRSQTRTRGKTPRRYWNWKPSWTVSDAATRGLHVEAVRMYEYEASKDFRFFSPALVDLGADEGDIVRIRRLGEVGGEFECVLAKKGTTEHAMWKGYCVQGIRNSPRRFGYA